MILAFPQEFLILSAFCISTYFLSQLLKTHGITVNNYLVKFYFTVLSILFSTWLLDPLNIKPPPSPSETSGRRDRPIPRKKLLVNGLLAAVGIAQGTPPIFSGRQCTLKQRLEHKTNIYGMLATERLNAKTLE